MDDEERFSTLFETHYAAVVRFAARRTDDESARDVAAETFLTAWRRLSAVPREPEQEVAWLYRTARNVLANERRGSRRRMRLRARLGSAVPARIGADHAKGVVEGLHVRESMGRLTARDQETLQLVAWDGLDPATAAGVVGCSPAAFAVRLHRARRRLDRELARAEEHADEDPDTPRVGTRNLAVDGRQA